MKRRRPKVTFYLYDRRTQDYAKDENGEYIGEIEDYFDAEMLRSQYFFEECDFIYPESIPICDIVYPDPILILEFHDGKYFSVAIHMCWN